MSTLAGTGVAGLSGDGSAAVDAQMNIPLAVCVDALGRIVITDTYNNRIRRIAANGSISSVNGVWNAPSGVAAADSEGGVLFVENHKAWLMFANGTTSAVAGTGPPGISVDGIAATTAQLYDPREMAIDSLGQVLISESYTSRVRVVGLDGRIRAFAGSGVKGFSGDGGPASSAMLNSPYGVAVNAAGIVFIADAGNNCIRRVAANGFISTVAGKGANADYAGDGGPATNARLNSPQAVAVDMQGRLLIADTNNHVVRRVELNGTIFTIAGTGAASFNGDGLSGIATALYSPRGVFVDSLGRLLIADSRNHRIRVLDEVCAVTIVAAVMAPLPPSYMQVWFTANRAGAPTSVTVGGAACFSVQQYSNANVSALCPLPTATSAVLSATLGGSVTATIPLAISPSSVRVIPFNGNISWGDNVTVVVFPAIAANISALGFAAGGRTAPCSALLLLNASAVRCSARVLLEAGLTQPLDVLITYSEGVTSTVATNFTFLRPTLRSFAPLVLGNSGGDAVTLELSQQIECASVRGWFGLVAALACQRIAPKTVVCTSPPGVVTFARITVELCGLFNVTSDGSSPSSALRSGEIAPYISCNPSAYFAAPLLQAAPQMVSRSRTNISIAASGLDVLGPMITGASIAGGRCSSIATVGNGTLRCCNWPYDATAGSPIGTAVVRLGLTLEFRGQSIELTPQLLALHAPQVYGVSPSTIAAGGRVVILGVFFFTGLGELPNVTVAGMPCTALAGFSDASLQCKLPDDVPVTTVGFPSLAVAVTTRAGVSDDEVRISILVPSTVEILDSTRGRLIASSNALNPSWIAPGLALTLTGDGPVTCTLGIVSWYCPAPVFSVGSPYIAPLPDVTLLGTVSQSVTLLVANASILPFNTVGLRAAAGCAVNVSAQCTDSTFRTFSPPSPLLIECAAPSIFWLTSTTDPLYVLPQSALPWTAAAVFAWPNGVTVHLWESLSCTAILVLESVPVPTDVPLSQVYGPTSASAGIVTALAQPGHANVSFPALGTLDCQLGRSYMLHAECVWQPTSERLRLAPVVVSIPSVEVTIAASGQHVAAYTNISVNVTIATRPFTMDLAASQCTWSLLNSSSAAQLIQYPMELWDREGDPASSLLSVLALEAGPSTLIYAQLTCVVYRQQVVAAVTRSTTFDMAIALLTPVPAEFMPSDTNARASSPVELQVALVADHGSIQLTDARCSIAVAGNEFTVSLLPPVGLGASVFTGVQADSSGVVTFPPFTIRAPLDVPSASLRLSCTRPHGDGPDPLVTSLRSVPLRAVMMTEPANVSASQAKLPPFQVAIASNSSSALPPILCSITQASSAAAGVITATSNMSVFLLGALASMQADGVAAFEGFSLTARPGFTYALVLTCMIGTMPIPPTHTFSLQLSGCPAGSEQADLLCQKCAASGAFSLGGEGLCTLCPPVGAVCANGLLSLLPQYFRPPSQARLPWGPDTELHQCFNAEACTLDADTLQYGCADGYTGPLCGVCSAADGYAKFGEACRPCWAPGASFAFVTIAALLVLLLLARVALRTVTQRSDASILLRITMSFIQAVGSVRIFKAGSTKAYNDVMGWTDAVSASPLSAGALQCVLRLSFLQQYVSTILLPVIAAVAVVAIFLTVTFAQAWNCTGQPSFARAAFRARVSAWLQSRRHLSTLLVVLFLAYMPITAASLRALDCSDDDPVDGIIYLRADLGVQCYIGQHAVARALAYAVLAAVGVGFPVGLGLLLARATRAQLSSAAFQATWGFLFDGYSVGTAATKARPILSAPREEISASSAPRSLVWWEAVVLLRKAGIVLLAVLVTNPYLQCVGATLWFGGHLLLHLHFQPFTKARFNHLETLSLAAACLSVVISTALLQYNQSEARSMTPAEWAITAVLAVINLTTLAVLGGAWAWAQCHQARRTVLQRLPSQRPDGQLTRNPLLAGRSVKLVLRQQEGADSLVANPSAAKLAASSLSDSRTVLAPAKIQRSMHR